jgi:hypothetical protein
VALSGRPVTVVSGADDQEVYFKNPEILATWLATRKW